MTALRKKLFDKLARTGVGSLSTLTGIALNKPDEHMLSYVGHAGMLSEVMGMTRMYGAPFYFNMLRMTARQMQLLQYRIFECDCFGFRWVKSDAPVSVEIGSHLGHFSRFVLSEKPNARVIAFEPDRDNFAITSRNLAPFPNAKAEWLAVSDREEELEFYVSSEVDWRSTLALKSGFINRPEFGQGEYTSSYKVKSVTLDNYFAKNHIDRLDHVVITVGGEVEILVLEGAAATIAKHRPIVGVLVYENTRQKVRDFFLKRMGGYEERLSPWPENTTLMIFVPVG